MEPNQTTAEFILSGSLRANLEATGDRLSDYCILPLTFKRMAVSFGGGNIVHINVPNITFAELRIRLHDRRQGPEPNLTLQYWNDRRIRWRSIRIGMGDLVWSKLSSNATSEQHRIGVEYFSR